MRPHPEVNRMGFYLRVNMSERGRERVREQEIINHCPVNPVASCCIFLCPGFLGGGGPRIALLGYHLYTV